MWVYKKLFIYLIAVLLLGVIVFFPHPIRAKIYKYTDSNGVTHYSDRPFYIDYCTYSQNSKGYIIQSDRADEIFLDRVITRVSGILIWTLP